MERSAPTGMSRDPWSGSVLPSPDAYVRALLTHDLATEVGDAPQNLPRVHRSSVSSAMPTVKWIDEGARPSTPFAFRKVCRAL